MLPESTRRLMPVVSTLSLLGLGVISLGGAVGCTKEPPKVTTPAGPAKSPEQESFDQIVAFMRHMLVDADPSRPGNVQRFPASGSNPATGGAEGVLTYDLKLDASPEIIPPANPGEPARGRIEVTMTTSYSRIQQQVPREESKPEEGARIKESTVEDIIRNPDLQVDPLDPEQILKESGIGREASKKPTGTVTLEPREEKVVFDLEYVDGMWRLANEDLETHLSSVVKTLETALARQR